jgi:hypothetical protein
LFADLLRPKPNPEPGGALKTLQRSPVLLEFLDPFFKLLGWEMDNTSALAAPSFWVVVQFDGSFGNFFSHLACP